MTDFAVVGEAMDELEPKVWATLTCCSGATDLDGPVDIVIVTEEPGTGLGARCAGLAQTDPGPELGDVPSSARVRIGGLGVALWALSLPEPANQALVEDELFDRAVFVGEAEGRWLWMILWPASAMLLLQGDWMLQDVGERGLALVELEFGGPPALW